MMVQDETHAKIALCCTLLHDNASAGTMLGLRESTNISNGHYTPVEHYFGAFRVWHGKLPMRRSNLTRPMTSIVVNQQNRLPVRPR
eukprot:8677014-Karenia_brevis.AAC.1